ncbi:MAG: 7-cyano-7-deazaguanine synthase [Proteobacteria bacterium]|nr:7-cyano-7-deazaguanine synthase [Pseudomonadota bacterium]
MSKRIRLPQQTPVLRVEILEANQSPKSGWTGCALDRNIRFSTDSLESYCFADWQPVVYDMLLLAAAVEFSDKSCKRPGYGWGRAFEIDLPVHDLALWRTPTVAAALRSALEFLTGDSWLITFRERSGALEVPQRNELQLPPQTAAVIPFSNGLDSRAVVGIMERALDGNLVRVRLGSARDASAKAKRKPFAAIPYSVTVDVDDREASGRSRGFKFALVAGVAAYLSKAHRIIMPESAQGALGPALVPVAYAYEDYRNHPLFTDRMTAFLRALLGCEVTYEFPQLWITKAETIKRSLETEQSTDLLATRTCWQRSQQVSVDHHRRQCGICAACLLRRMSFHAAGLSEPQETYVWENLSASEFKLGAAPTFNPDLITRSQREYSIAGVLHLDHLAGLNQSEVHAETLGHTVFQLSNSLGLREAETASRLDRVLDQHRSEWKAFMASLGSNSFLADWLGGGQR